MKQFGSGLVPFVPWVGDEGWVGGWVTESALRVRTVAGRGRREVRRGERGVPGGLRSWRNFFRHRFCYFERSKWTAFGAPKVVQNEVDLGDPKRRFAKDSRKKSNKRDDQKQTENELHFEVQKGPNSIETFAQFLAHLWSHFGTKFGPILGRCWVAFEVDFGVDVGSIWGRFWDRF